MSIDKAPATGNERFDFIGGGWNWWSLSSFFSSLFLFTEETRRCRAEDWDACQRRGWNQCQRPGPVSTSRGTFACNSRFLLLLLAMYWSTATAREPAKTHAANTLRESEKWTYDLTHLLFSCQFLPLFPSPFDFMKPLLEKKKKKKRRYSVVNPKSNTKLLRIPTSNSLDLLGINPFSPKSDQCQMSPTASPEI